MRVHRFFQTGEDFGPKTEKIPAQGPKDLYRAIFEAMSFFKCESAVRERRENDATTFSSKINCEVTSKRGHKRREKMGLETGEAVTQSSSETEQLVRVLHTLNKESLSS
jgi:hypothetical protein